jgi:predicted outer membrane repeat protein
MQMRISTAAIALSGFIVATASAQYAQVTVEQDGSGQFTTITAALEGLGGQPAEVYVGPGVYAEYAAPGVAVALNQSGIHLISTDGPATTIIDGSYSRCCIMVNSGAVLGDLEVTGFTLRHGSSTNGGGLLSVHDTIAVFNCVFVDNAAGQTGGAVFIGGGGVAELTGCSFNGNTAGNGYGGAIYASNASVQLDSCDACDNGPSAMSSGVTWNSQSLIWELCDDCNDNGIDDDIDAENGVLTDIDDNGLWDSCEPDCNGNNVADALECAVGFADDVNGNFVPDECESDCDGDGLPDDYELEIGLDQDCNGNGIPDACDIADGLVEVCDLDFMPDECQVFWEDCDGNGIHDGCDIQDGGDCNENEVLDACEILDGTEDDLDGNDIPDTCECLADIDGTGYVYYDEIVIWMYLQGNAGGPADVDHSGFVDIRDLIYILMHWGDCPES